MMIEQLIFVACLHLTYKYLRQKKRWGM